MKVKFDLLLSFSIKKKKTNLLSAILNEEKYHCDEKLSMLAIDWKKNQI